MRKVLEKFVVLTIGLIIMFIIGRNAFSSGDGGVWFFVFIAPAWYILGFLFFSISEITWTKSIKKEDINLMNKGTQDKTTFNEILKKVLIFFAIFFIIIAILAYYIKD